MPIAFDPDQRADFSTTYDQRKPEDQRAVFTTTFLTVRARMKMRALIHQALNDDDDDETALGHMLDGLALGLVGWRNLRGRDGKPVEYTSHESLQELPAVLTDFELVDLATTMLNVVMIGPAEKKVSESPSASNGEPSAADAPPDGA